MAFPNGLRYLLGGRVNIAMELNLPSTAEVDESPRAESSC